MADKDKPVADTKPTKEPKAKEPKVQEPKVEEPASGPAASTDDAAAPAAASDVAQAGTDQYGRQLYNVTCASCGKTAQVPFKPAGDRPVYCRDCYMQQRGGRMGGSGRGPRR